MRIIRGERKGKQIQLPKDFSARPTTDFAKTGLFNVIDNTYEFENLYILDLFAGSGSISYEFASRNVGKVVAVEFEKKHADFIRNMALKMGFNQLSVIHGDALKFIRTSLLNYDIIFADPPYDLPELPQIPDIIFENKSINKEVLFILEHPGSIDFTKHPNFLRGKKYGKVNFTFFSIQEEKKEE